MARASSSDLCYHLAVPFKAWILCRNAIIESETYTINVEVLWFLCFAVKDDLRHYLLIRLAKGD